MLLLNMLSGSQRFYFLFTIVMKVLVSGTDNPNLLIEVLDELQLFIDKKIIFDGKKMSVGLPFCNLHNFLTFNLDTSPFQVKDF
jgi:hypothetical protein